MTINKIKDIDITKSGPMTFRDLQAVNQESYTNLSPEFQSFSNEVRAITAPTSLYDARSHGEQLVSSSLSNTSTPWGESRFDNATASEEQFQHLGDLRANNQSWYSKIGAGMAKGAILAGTTFADGTIGMVVGATQAAVEGRFSALWDNPFSKAMQLINEESEKALPNYYTETEIEGPWYENIFTANFIGDKFIKNLGFTVGAFYGGGVASKAIKASKLPKLIGIVTKSTKAPAMVTSAVGATMSAINEGRIEALNNSKDWFEMQKAQLDDKHMQTLDAIQEQYGNTEIYNNLIRQAELNYNQSLEKLSEDRLKMGNADLLMNLPILLASNITQFGRLYAQGYKTTRKATNIIKKEGKYATSKNYIKGVSKASINALSEGIEEISQSAASRISGNYYATDVNNFYKSKIDPQAEQETLSWIKAFCQGINETVNDGSAWEEFFIGTLTGALGMPRFRGVRNSEGKFQSPITIDGGIYGEMKEYKEQMNREQTITDEMNKRIESSEFINYYQGLIRHNKYQQDMDRAVIEDSEFDFKNAEHAQLLSDIMMFDNAGKTEDLFTLIDAAYDVSDENLVSIVENTTSIVTDEDGKESKIGSFVDKNGNPMYSTPEGKQNMIDKLTKTKENIINTINDYIKTKDDIDIRTGEQLSDDQLEELVWLKSQIKDWQGRAETLAGEVNPVIHNLIGELSRIADYLNTVKQQEGQNHTGLTDTYREADKREELLRKNISVLERIASLDNKTLANILAIDEELVKGIKNSLDNPSSSIGQDEIESINIKIDDIVKLKNATTLFNTKLKEYLDNPSKITKDNKDTTEKIIKENVDNKSKNLREKLSSAKDLNDFRNIINSEEDTTIKQETLDSLEEEGNELAKNYKDINSYNSAVSVLINSSKEDQATKNDALELLKQQFIHSSTLEEMTNTDSVYITDEGLFDDSASEEERINRHQNALYLLQESMNIANKSNKFKDRFSKVVEVEKSKDIEDIKENSTEPEEKVTTVTTSNKVPTPIGDITSEDVSNENKATNDLQENLTDDSKKGNRQYYRPVIPELHIEAVKEGDFRPFSEVVAEKEGKDFSTLYNYLRDKGAFEYVNSGKLKQGDTIKFMVDPILEEAMKTQLEDSYIGPTILMVTESGQVVGSIDSTPNSVNKFIGLGKLREDINNEYNKSYKSKLFIATPTTSVSKIMTGKIPYSNQERSLKDISGIGENPVLGIMQAGSIHNPKVNDSKITNPQDTSNKEGRLYLLISNATRKYSPVAVRVKHFNSTEFNPEDINVSSTEVYKQINRAIEELAKANNEHDLGVAVSNLGKVLYTGTLHIDFITNRDGDTLLKISKVELDKFGREIYDNKDGKRVRRETTSFIKISSDITKSPDYVGYIGEKPEVEKVDVQEIKEKITEVLLNYNLPIQVNKEQLGDKKYVQDLIQSNVLTSNITEAAVKGSWFTTNYIENGEEKKAINPTYTSTTISRTTPVGGVESVIPGTKISLGGAQYSVDRTNGKIYNNEGNEINPSDRQLLLDLAYAQDVYGNKENGSSMWNNKVLLPTGRVLDRTTQKYLSDKEAEEVISHINAETKKAEDKKKHSDNTLEKIKENQSKVDKERTDSENYYILEDDGEYHPYQRVHTKLGNNWVQTSGQTEALRSIRDKLMQLSGTTKEYNNYLDFISNKYKVVLDNFKDKTDAKSRDAIVNLVRDKMSNTNSTRALNAGSSIDSIIKTFFTSNDAPIKPNNMSNEAFKQLIDSLTEIRSNIEARGERFLTNNIVLFNKYPDGTRVAGEVDILSIDKDGNFRIYDVKTSKYSFYTFKDYQGKEVNYFKNKSNSQRISGEQYYTLQLSAYKSLFEAQYDDKIVSLAILPFVLSYSGDNITGITKEKGIPVNYNKGIQQILGSPLKSESVVTIKQEPINTTLSIFNSALEIQNPINRVLPNYELEDSKVGYYELNGKLYKSYLSPIGKVNGNEVYMTKEPVMTKGFGKEEYVGFNKYIAVFSNGQAVVIIPNSKTSDVESDIKTLIKDALNKNPQRVVDESSKTTTISKSILSSSSSTLSGAAKTIQAEKAIDKKDAEFEDELDLDRLRKKDKEIEKTWNQEKELNWLDNVLPQLSREDRVKIAKGLIKVGNQGAVAWGQFNKGMITLSDIAAEGTTYHEAFHVVFNLLLDQKERQALYEEARQIYGNKDNLSLEEEMAEGFREYVMSRDTDNLLTKIKNFFKDLWIKVTNWNKLQPSLLSMYQRINEGKYANMELSNNEDSTRYRKLSSIKELREQAKTQYEQYNVDMEEYYRYAQDVIKELNNRRYNTKYEAKEAFDKSGIDPALFYRITKLGANNANGYKIQLLTRDLFEDYKKNNNPAIIDDIYDSINNKPEEFLFNTLDPEIQMSLLNKGWSEEQWNNRISQEERDQALRCLNL